MYWNFPLHQLNWRGFNGLFGEFNRLFNHVAEGRAGYPRLNVWTNEDGAELAVELPGMAPEDVELSVHGNEITIRGEKAAPEAEEGETWHRSERLNGAFSRTVTLPFQVDAKNVSAEGKNGILTVKVARAAADKPEKIKVIAA